MEHRQLEPADDVFGRASLETGEEVENPVGPLFDEMAAEGLLLGQHRRQLHELFVDVLVLANLPEKEVISDAEHVVGHTLDQKVFLVRVVVQGQSCSQKRTDQPQVEEIMLQKRVRIDPFDA